MALKSVSKKGPVFKIWPFAKSTDFCPILMKLVKNSWHEGIIFTKFHEVGQKCGSTNGQILNMGPIHDSYFICPKIRLVYQVFCNPTYALIIDQLTFRDLPSMLKSETKVFTYLFVLSSELDGLAFIDWGFLTCK